MGRTLTLLTLGESLCVRTKACNGTARRLVPPANHNIGPLVVSKCAAPFAAELASRSTRPKSCSPEEDEFHAMSIRLVVLT
jgi:hypothetical protein